MENDFPTITKTTEMKLEELKKGLEASQAEKAALEERVTALETSLKQALSQLTTAIQTFRLYVETKQPK